MEKFLRHIAIFALAATAGVIFYLGCGGGASGRTINLGGIVMAPTVSGNIAALPSKRIGKAVTQGGTQGINCTIYTLEGENLGTATTGSDGSFTVAVNASSLKGAEDTGTTWSEEVVLDCSNGVQLYQSIQISEDTTTDVNLGTANIETTLATGAMAGKISGWSGWGESYKTAASSIDLACIFSSENSLWNNSTISGAGMADDSGILKDTLSGFIAAGGSPSDAGYINWDSLIQAMLNGTISQAAWAQIASYAASPIGSDASTLAAAYDTSYQALAAVDNIFSTQFASGGLGLTALTTAAAGKSVCDSIKDGSLDINSFVRPMLSAENLSEFTAIYGDSEGVAVHFGFMEECIAGGYCSDIATEGGAYYGFLKEYGGDFSDIWTGTAFDEVALEGAVLAAKSCSGSTSADLIKCADAMYDTVYAGADGDWTLFMSGGDYDADYFDYWGAYYTGLLEGEGDFDPDSLNYDNLWSTESGSMGSSDIEQCVDAVLAAGGYDTAGCYVTFTSSQYDTYTYSDTTSSEACNFSNILDSIDVYYSDGTYILYMYFGSYSSYDTLHFSYDSTTGTATYSSGSYQFTGKFAVDTTGNLTFMFTDGTLPGAGTCTQSGGSGKVYEYASSY